MSLAEKWDAVNGEVLRCLAIQASMDHDPQLDCHTIPDVKWINRFGNHAKYETIKQYNT